MKIIKFGGTSVQTSDRIKGIIEIMKADKSIRITICSALGGITDQLIETAKKAAQGEESYQVLFSDIEQKHLNCARNLVSPNRQDKTLSAVKAMLNELADLLRGISLVKELSNRTLDYVVSFGERLSCFIVSEACKEAGLNAVYLDTRKVVKTDSNFTSAAVNFELTNQLIKDFVAKNPQMIIATGFIGSNSEGITTTLGRGGSDYSCSIFAAALDAKELEIWTDVDGVMTADPRKVPQAFSLPTLTYEEAMEMSHFGAKVIHPPTMLPAMKKNIPIIIRNTFKPAFKGTVIGNDKNPEGKAIKGISSISHIALLRIEGSGMVGVAGISARLFNSLATDKISVVLITQGSSEHSICLAVKPEDGIRAKKTIEFEFKLEIQAGYLEEVVVETELAVVAVVGENMRNTSGIAGTLFKALGNNGINIVAIAQGSSELNVSVVIKRENETKALRAIHQAFFLSDVKTIHLFIVGVGLIGSELLEQLQQQAAYLLQTFNLEFRVIGLSNSKKYAMDKNGLDLKTWKETLKNSEKQMSISQFIQEMNLLGLPNAVFVDNTASAEVANSYQKLLKNSISVVTPNKLASSGSYEQFANLKAEAKNHGVIFLYETNVGAALPVISTLRDLVNSGDKIVKIEAVLSGTLSFIFNTFNGKQPFSEVVKTAKAKGYTEPDPRDDLGCTDVARKILILARECGQELEFADVKINGFLPESCLKAATVDDFFKELEKNNDYFEVLRSKAAAEGKILRCIAKFENGKAEVGLQGVDANHAFYNLSGSDNIIAFTTLRYPIRPLVVRGSGAGAEVTAAGVFADIIRVGNYL